MSKRRRVKRDMQDVLLGVEASRRVGWSRYTEKRADHEQAEVLIDRQRREIAELRDAVSLLREAAASRKQAKKEENRADRRVQDFINERQHRSLAKQGAEFLEEGWVYAGVWTNPSGETRPCFESPDGRWRAHRFDNGWEVWDFDELVSVGVALLPVLVFDLIRKIGR